MRVWKPLNPQDKAEVRKAFNLAADAHQDMRRRTGEPYIYHPLEVARIVAGEIGLGKTSVICALLHDVVEDTDYTLDDIENIFGKKVARIIDGLTKIKGFMDKGTGSVQAENFKKMLFTLSDDVRVILIKLADRLHNMRTLDAMPVHKQLKIASETTYLYAPLAHRFGLYSIKTELEDLSLKYTEPEIYKSITAKIESTEKERKRFAQRFIFPIKKSLSKNNFVYEIVFRTKSVSSIWNKMKEKGIPFEEIYDITAIRIIIDTPPEKEKMDCWRVYSIITDHYRPKIDRLRDWISIPKANGYEALHTTVMSQDGHWVEVQIRTSRMDEIAEKGYAAHWRYKNSPANVSESSINNWLDRIRDMLQSNDSSALDFIDDFKGFLITDEIYVFTPQGELRNLPVNSSVIDFAYAIHSEIGNTCIGAKVNHKLAPLNQKLKSGDQVEIITSKKQTPKEDWFNYVVTARARTQIKQGIKEERKKYAEEGKNLMENYFRQFSLEPTPSNIKQFQQKYNYNSLIDLYYDFAKGKLGIKEVRDCCGAEIKESWISKIIKRPFARNRNVERKTLTETVIDELKKHKELQSKPVELQKISYEIANCCMPIPGDEIVGFIEPGEAIKIHHTNCPVAINQMSKYGNKIIHTTWNDKETVGFLSGIEIHGIDNHGFIKEIIGVITEKLKINIKSFHLETTGGIIDARIMLYVYSLKELKNLMDHLDKVPDVKKVRRIGAKD
ncbi:MAG: bifunctional (p)ppGpp synthetase/guanosine-3',5'-bis(diphosphate) 3'-pyrophosphohydrolase [Bacteroidales bacterium]|nr:bifunctional (p)ppGpp synthetase/guanosine-3',5'-bis(diphosphate) 3'-pyrophosphohydrolase [Bacteroidales bacterium]